jgi:hypothetical protein
MAQSLNHWWRTDLYTDDTHVPSELVRSSGPHGVALVRAWNDGRTDAGWGLRPTEKTPGFMALYTGDKFHGKRVLPAYEKGAHNFAFVMRSMSLICVDIDGKNDGFTGANRLGPLTETLAETSKSGNGYHLFYKVDDLWDPELGYAKYSDKIGIEQGVDLRATGCVYHTPTQRWNKREIAPIPDFLAQRLDTAKQQYLASQSTIQKILDSQEGHEILMLHTELLDDLAKPIPAGRRNNTLFAIGSKMKDAGVEDWQLKVKARALDVGLDNNEADKLVANIGSYS